MLNQEEHFFQVSALLSSAIGKTIKILVKRANKVLIYLELHGKYAH